MNETLKLTQDWDKVFPKSEQVNHRKITFHNRYGITLAADLYEPKKVKVNYQPSLLVDHLVQSKNNHLVYMHKKWQKMVF